MRTRQFFLALCGGALFVACATGQRPAGGGGGVWQDAALVHDQERVIEEQRGTLERLGNAIGEVRSDLERARSDLDRAISETSDLRKQWAAIDQFVRGIIEAERRLENLQHPDSGADAGSGSGVGGAL